jgi:hypothetical protein
MIELILIAIFLALILIIMMLKAWLPRMSHTWYINSDTYEQRIDVVVTLRGTEVVDESYSITSLGLSKNFKVFVLFETSYLFSKDEDRNYHHGELTVMSIENSNSLQHQDEGFVIQFNDVKDKPEGTSSISLLCTNDSYDFLKSLLRSNSLITLEASNSKIFRIKGDNHFIIKGRVINMNMENSYRSTNSLRRFIKKYSANTEALNDSYLNDWFKEYKEKLN